MKDFQSGRVLFESIIYAMMNELKISSWGAMGYLLNSQLEAESFSIGALRLCEVRLMNNQNLVWLILIPMQESVKELIDLSSQDQGYLLSEINLVSNLLKQHFPCDKLNIAMLGNVVSQLHVHVIARCFDDIYFPKAPFGLPGTPYSLEERALLIKKIQALL